MCLSNWPNGGPTPTADDDRFWAAAVDMDMKISPHVNFDGRRLPAAKRRALIALLDGSRPTV